MEAPSTRPKAKAPATRAPPPPRSLHDPMGTGVILLAAGNGRRFGGQRPKQFLPLQGSPLFLKSLRAFGRLRSITDVVIVASPSSVPHVHRLLRKFRVAKA